MKIVIAGGRNEADFLISSLIKKNHKLVIINDDEEYSTFLAKKHDIPVLFGDPRKQYLLDDSNIKGFDIIISLLPNDPDNLAICQAAKRIYGVKKSVCIVSNPKNVDIFKTLGVNTVISSTYMIANIIEQASTFKNLIKILPFEEEKVVLTEIIIDENCKNINKKVKDINFPSNSIISCVIRDTDMFVPNGQTDILLNDKLLMISSPNNQDEVIHAISGV